MMKFSIGFILGGIAGFILAIFINESDDNTQEEYIKCSRRNK